MSASERVSSTQVRESLKGQPIAQVLYAENAVLVGAQEGGVIRVVTPGKQAADRIRPHPSPPRIFPRKVPDFVDREQEQGLLGRALARSQIVDLHAADGLGKTALVSRSMRTGLPSAFPDGMVYLSAEDETAEDLLHALFECFYATDKDIKATANLVRRHMAGKQALIAVDDAHYLEEGEADKLAQAAPNCAFLFSGQRPQTRVGGTSVDLRGLPREHAVALFERNWGRLSAQDKPTVEAICQALDNVPLLVTMAGSIAAQRRVPLPEVLRHVQPRGDGRGPARQLFRLVRSTLSREERQVLGGLAAPGGRTVGVEALPEVTGLTHERVQHHLDRLERMGLVHSHSPRYSLDDGLRPHVRLAWSNEQMRARAADHYRRQASRLRGKPKDPDEPNVMAALGYYLRRKQWRHVIYIVRAVERYLATAGRWGQWRRRLRNAWYAAREAGDRAAEAWAQNQLAIIATSVGNAAAATKLFRAALDIWTALGNETGMTIARWNLQVLLGPPPVPSPGDGPSGAGGGGSPVLPLMLAATASVMVLLFVLVYVVVINPPGPEPTLPSPESPVVCQCGNEVCESDSPCFEDRSSCPSDCCYCGDGVCDDGDPCGETTANCRQDCPPAEPPPCVCGNGVCDGGDPCGETTANCPQDCPPTEPPPCICGNGFCERGSPCNEDGYNCPDECCRCGDGICEARDPCGETSAGCPQDCPITEPPPCVCGNGFCERGSPCNEDGYNCPDECCRCEDGLCERDSPCGEDGYTCAYDCCRCGDGICERDDPCGETGYSCAPDCCRCGDGICERGGACGEDGEECADDCCRCGDGICETESPCYESPSGCPSDCPLPDLQATGLAVTGSQVVNEDRNIEVPIRVTIRNAGGATADTFKVSTSVSAGSGSSPVAFTVPGEDNSWFPYTSAPLAGGAEVSFDGVVTIGGDLHSQTVSLRALADSCAWDEFMPEYCRVQESNENNNESSPVSVSLPAKDTTGPLILSISLDPPEPTTEDVITVEAIIEDESGVAQAVFWYRAAEGGWRYKSMDPIGGDKYGTLIGPLSPIGSRLYYLVEARDTGGYESQSVELTVTVTVPGPD